MHKVFIFTLTGKENNYKIYLQDFTSWHPLHAAAVCRYGTATNQGVKKRKWHYCQEKRPYADSSRIL